MKRIFAAIDISDDARREISNYIENLRDEFSGLRVGWERAEKLHLTLKFFGDVEEKSLEKIIEAAAQTANAFSPFDLQIVGTGAFPSKRNAKILWLGVKDDAENLRRLNEIYEKECAMRSFPKETRIFKPHLTIGRLREPHFSKGLTEKHLQNQFAAPAFTVSEIVVYESRLQKSGSAYFRVQSSRFKVVY